MITALLSGWILVGAGFDAWAHINQKPDTFFSPWHGLVYSGFFALMAWMVWTVRGAIGRDLLSARNSIPVGYGLGLIGGALFLVAGIADGVWHTLFGIEVDLEAVLSPSHIGLLVGVLLLFSTPFRAAWASTSPGNEPTLQAFLPALLSVTFTAAMITLFLGHTSAFAEQAPVLGLPSAPPRGSLAQYRIEHGFMSVLATNLMLIGPLLLALRRWRPPFGTATIALGGVALLHIAVHEFNHPWLLLAAAAGGLAADWCMTRGRQGADPSRVHLLAATVTPLVLWSCFFLALHLQHGLTWSAELWAGSIVFAVLSGFALHLLMVLPRLPREIEETVIAQGLTRWPR